MSGNKAVKAGLGYTIGNILIRGIGFLSIPIFTRLMGTADYGLYNTYAAYEGIFYLMISLALNSSIKTAKLEFKERFDEYVSTIVAIVLANMGLWLVIANIVYPIISNQFWEFDRSILNVLVLHSCGSALIVIYNAVVGVRFQYKAYLGISLLNSVGSVCISILLIVLAFSEHPFSGRIFGAFGGASIAGIIIIIVLLRRSWPNFRKGYVKFALKYSLPVVPHGISQVLLAQFDRIMIEDMVGAAAAGIYSFTGNVSSIMKVIVNSVISAWSPWFFEAYNRGDKCLIRKVTHACISGFALFTCGVMLCMPEVLKLMAPSDYWDGIRLVIPMALDVFCTFLYAVYVEVEYYFKKTHYLMLATIGAAIINVILNVIMIPRFGYVAAAYTTLFSYVCYFVFHYIVSCKLANEDVFNFKKNVGQIIICIIIGIFTAVFLNKWLVRWIMAAALCLGYGIKWYPEVKEFLNTRINKSKA